VIIMWASKHEAWPCFTPCRVYPQAVGFADCGDPAPVIQGDGCNPYFHESA
jgi:hypothetical protein